MKRKNYGAAIHNFAYSFLSIDYRISGKQAINVLIELHQRNLETRFKVDFIRDEVLPFEASTKSGSQLASDYKKWLPEHLENHECEFSILELLEIDMWADFTANKRPPRMNDSTEVELTCCVSWKIVDREKESRLITQTDLVKNGFLVTGVPEL